jgi:uncharacterized membrane protein HdeD (DUF308 family)
VAPSFTERGFRDVAAGPRRLEPRAADGVPPDRALGRVRLGLIAVGALSLLAGAAAIFAPAVASLTATLFVGWVLIAAGALAAADAWSLRRQGGLATRVARAALAVFIGIWLVAFPLSGTFTLTVLLAAWFFAAGVVQLVGAWQLRGRPGAAWTALNGVASLVLGVLIVADLPSSALWALGLLLGIDLIFWGVRALATARMLAAARPAPWT